jgi:hypothetical protein
MNGRDFLTATKGAVATSQLTGTPERPSTLSFCDCAMQPRIAIPPGASTLSDVGSKVRITNLKTFGVTILGAPTRSAVRVKLETNEGLVGWSEGTLEGKAGAVIACVNDFREFLIGAYAGGAPLAIDLYPQFLSRRPGDRFHDFRSGSGAVRPSRQDSRRPGVQVAGRARRSRRSARLLHRERAHAGRFAASSRDGQAQRRASPRLSQGWFGRPMVIQKLRK